MKHVLKFAAPAFALTLGFVGSLQAAGDHMQQQSQGSGTPSATMDTANEKMATIQGTVEKIDGEVFTIKNEQGGTIRLHLSQDAFQGEQPKEGDTIKAKIPQGEETYDVVSVNKEGQSGSQKGGQSMQAQSSSQSQQGQSSSKSQSAQDGQFTRTIKGEISKVDGNVYYVQDPSGKEIRLRLDQSAEQSGDLKKGDKIEALVTQKKEFHVISAEPVQ